MEKLIDDLLEALETPVSERLKLKEILFDTIAYNLATPMLERLNDDQKHSLKKYLVSGKNTPEDIENWFSHNMPMEDAVMKTKISTIIQNTIREYLEALTKDVPQEKIDKALLIFNKKYYPA